MDCCAFVFQAIETLNSILNYSDHFLVSMLNYTGGDDKPFTEVEYTTLEKLINDTKVSRTPLALGASSIPLARSLCFLFCLDAKPQH